MILGTFMRSLYDVKLSVKGTEDPKDTKEIRRIERSETIQEKSSGATASTCLLMTR